MMGHRSVGGGVTGIGQGIVWVVAVSLGIAGCATVGPEPPSGGVAERTKEVGDILVELIDGTRLELDDAEVRGAILAGRLSDGETIEVPWDQVRWAWRRRLDSGDRLVGLVAVVGTVGVLAFGALAVGMSHLE